MFLPREPSVILKTILPLSNTEDGLKGLNKINVGEQNHFPYVLSSVI